VVLQHQLNECAHAVNRHARSNDSRDARPIPTSCEALVDLIVGASRRRRATQLANKLHRIICQRQA
jgi:hypothetical protein